MAEVSVREARDDLSRLIKRAQDGEEIVITRRGRPVARLVAISSARGRELVEWLAANPLPPTSRRRNADIDAAIPKARENWD